MSISITGRPHDGACEPLHACSEPPQGTSGLSHDADACAPPDALPAAQVPFEQVPDLVATRRVLLRGGWAFVSRHEVASLVVSRFRAGLSHALVLTARRWATLIADEEADRLTPLISTLSER